jgi:menaquinone-9 beta-reductase
MAEAALDAEWDVVVAGASFGGLAAAMALNGHGRVLLLDKDPIGANQTSACAAPLPLLERLGAGAAVEQVHEFGVLHLPGGPADQRGHRFGVRHPFATFDYRRLCELLFCQTGATFLQASVTGLRGREVLTSRGGFRAPVLVDASGWRAALAGSPTPRRSVGLELCLPGPEEGLHFWLHHPAVRDGYAWDFPAGGQRRVGVLTYGASGGLRRRLERFVGRRVEGREVHGGSLPAGLRDPVARDLFVVGDAAGQCLPFTGEGIRQALVFGWLAGSLAADVLRGRLQLPAALERYRAVVSSTAFSYRALASIQSRLGGTPRWTVKPFSWLFGAGPLARPAERYYWSAPPMELVG